MKIKDKGSLEITDQDFSLRKKALSLSRIDEKMKILITEDDFFSITYLKLLLGKHGYETVVAENGQKAVDMVKADRSIRYVLMDIKLPVMDGFTATRLIKEFDPGIKVIAQTAYALSGDRERSLHSGFDDYLTKPLHADSLLRILEDFSK